MILILLTAFADVNTMSQGDLDLYICLCHGITDSQIRACVEMGARTLSDLSGELGIATQCGCCAQSALEVIEETLACSSGACQTARVAFPPGNGGARHERRS
jgi:bacterioferritin-associated ferredoxin